MPSTSNVTVTLEEGMHFDALNEVGVSVALDSSPEHGGQSAGYTPMELLLVGLGGCTAMDVISILRKKRQVITSYRVEVSGVRRDEHPRVFTEITVRHLLEGADISSDAVRRAIELSETKYCSAHAMLSETAKISSSFELHPAVAVD